MDIDSIFASDLKYLRKIWDIKCITCPNWSKIIFCTDFSAHNAGNRILGHWNFGILKRRKPPDPSRRRGVSLFSIRSVTFFKPAGYFNYYWNPWKNDKNQSDFTYLWFGNIVHACKFKSCINPIRSSKSLSNLINSTCRNDLPDTFTQFSTYPVYKQSICQPTTSSEKAERSFAFIIFVTE